MAYQNFDRRLNERFWDDLCGEGYPLDFAARWIGENLSPDDVFDENALGAWAEEHGYVREAE